MKHLLTLTLLCFGLMAQAQIPSYVPTNGLVGWWPFNGNANDESGNGNHGTVNGATLAADRFGNAGKAYSFDGISSFIQFPCNITTNTTTASVWFKSNSNGFQSIIDNDIAPLYGNNIILNYANSGNKIDLLFHDGVFRTNATFQINSIYHAVAVWNDSNCKLYYMGTCLCA